METMDSRLRGNDNLEGGNDDPEKGATKFDSVRFGNVLGSRGSVLPLFLDQLKHGGPLTVTHEEMRRYFMTIPEAVHLVLQAGGLAECGELFALNMGKPVKIVDLATDMVRLSGLSPEDIPVVFTGIRPGEKLTEALWEPDAVAVPTGNPDVLKVIESDDLGREELAAALRRLQAAAADGDVMALQAVLAQCIPTFVPSQFTPRRASERLSPRS